MWLYETTTCFLSPVAKTATDGLATTGLQATLPPSTFWMEYLGTANMTTESFRPVRGYRCIVYWD